MTEKILLLLSQNQHLSTGEISSKLNIDRTTTYRNLQKLIKLDQVIQIKKWLYAYKEPISKFFDLPFWQRPSRQYNRDFLDKYIPNETNFLSENDNKLLSQNISNIWIHTDFYKNNKQFIETSLIDLSYASSYLEWNTYSYLDTEILLKYNEIAKNKQKDETQMIINHKKSIEYMIYNKNNLTRSAKSFFEIHSILWSELLSKKDLWVIRNGSVEIWLSTYKPLDNEHQLKQEFDKFIKKLNEIKNPFEKSLFILIYIPYFQIFVDINKRTSRMMANLALIQANLPLFSMIQISQKEYITAILSIYELNDPSSMVKIFVENYIANINRYKHII